MIHVLKAYFSFQLKRIPIWHESLSEIIVNKSDIYPQKSQAKKFPMKELARRNILNGGPVMKMKKWDVKRLVNKLERTPPNDKDVQHIRKE